MASTHSSLKGQFLLDGGKLSGSYFNRSVVLICEHNREGAFGLILNRPSENRLEDVLEPQLPSVLRQSPLFNGGPVQSAALSFLYLGDQSSIPEVIPNLHVGHALEDLVALGEALKSDQKLRVFAGYAGWTAGQLDDEIDRESWVVIPASIDRVFSEPAEELWRKLIRTSGDWKLRLLADGPEDPSVN